MLYEVITGDLGEYTLADIPADLADAAAKGREKVVEAAAEADDTLLEKYLEGDPLSEEEIRRGFTVGVRAMKLLPVLCGSATRCIGIQPLLDMINFVLPDPSFRKDRKGTHPKTKTEEARPISADAPFSAFRNNFV